MNYRLTNYPTAIDPASVSLEVNIAAIEEADGPMTLGSSRTATYWRHLHRLSPLSGPWVRDAAATHLFGDQPLLPDCTFALAYTCQGILSQLWYNRYGHWERFSVSEEVSGLGDLRPSVRIVFADNTDHHRFCNALSLLSRDFRANRSPLPDVALEIAAVMSRSPCEPRHINVALLPGEQAIARET